MDYNPAVVALSALYAASKVEEIVFDAHDLVARFDACVNGVDSDADLEQTPMSVDQSACRVSADALLNTELWFLQQINFHLICYHPFKSLGIVREKLHSSTIFAQGEHSNHLLSELIAIAENIIRRRSLLTDLPLSHPPAVIAIAATVIAAEIKSNPQEQQLLQVLVGPDHKALNRIQTATQILRPLPDQTPENEAREVAALEQRRQAVQKNINDPMSREYREMQLQQLSEEDAEELERARVFQEKLKRRSEALLGFANMNISRKKRKVEA
ncbi:Cyclin-like protein [Gracilaria domingensis]|nr:Cyclin-like protein [Gracilaria domingensis]